MRRFAWGRGWPRGAVHLLLRANLAEAESAALAWRTWRDNADFEKATWPEMRLLAPLAARIALFDPETPLLPRINGLAKNLWTKTHLALRETAGAFARLDADGIPFIVFKGGAQYAEELATSTRRIMGDVDILVPPERAIDALDALEEAGWESSNGESFELLRSLADTRLSGNFRKGVQGEIDLHVSPFHFSRIDPALDREFWARSSPAQLALRPVRVPDPTDSVLLLLAHSATSESGDWAMDIATRLPRQTLDWPRLADDASRRGLVPVCRSGLTYLARELSLPIPEVAFRELGRRRVSLAEHLKFWSNVRDRAERGLVEKAVNRLADRLLRREGFSVIVKDHRAIVVTRSTLGLRRLLRRSRPVAVPSGLLPEHRFGAPLDGRRLVIRLALPSPATSRRIFFDLAINDIGIARLRSRAGGRGETEIERVFSIPIPHWLSGNAEIALRARPVRFIPPDATPEARAELEPIPFRLLEVLLA